jgi:monoamine oxidase
MMPALVNRRAFIGRREPALTRREVVGAGLAAGLAFSVGCGPSSARRPRGRAIVVGAGLAGLVAAGDLGARGFRVTVVEARARLGGRVHTARFAGGQHAEAGGEFVDVNHRALLALVRRSELGLENVRRGGVDLPGAAYLRGRRFDADDLYTPRVEAQIARYERRMEALARRPAAGLDARSVASLLDELALGPAARFLVEHDLRDEYTVEPDRLSLLFHARAWKLTEDVPESGIEAYRVRGGNSRLPRALADDLDVQLGTPVDAVVATAGGVRVETGARALRGDFCVVAAPLPALRAVRFDPGLPARHAEAVRDMQYGTGVKTLLQYRRRIWRSQGFNGDTFTDLTVGTTWGATDGQPGTPGVLLGYTGAAAGTALGELSAPERVARVAGELDRIYPGSRALLARAGTYAWQRERFTGGTYTAYAPGQMTRFAAAIRRPHGRIHFAGEHTDAFASYMEGAVRSGHRAAREIAARA